MQSLFDPVMLSRIQFGITAMFHIIWPVVTIGLSIYLFVMEALWLRTKDPEYLRQCRFWGRLFFLNMTVGVVSGIPMEFQFGTNWGPFSIAGGDFFGHMLGFEATMAFMLEAAFVGIMMFGWKRVSPRMHLFSTGMVAFGATLSAFWIMTTSSWMHTPTGGYFENGRFVLTSHVEAIFNPDMPWGFSHMWVAALEITIFVVGAVSAWHLLRGRSTAFFLRSFKAMVIASVVVTPLQVILGDGSGAAVFTHQPAKLAAIEAHWKTNPPGEGAPWSVLAWPDPDRRDNAWSLEIPYGLSLILTHSPTGTVRGLREFPREDQPPVLIPYYAFRIMMGIGFLMVLLMLWTVVAWRKGKLTEAGIAAQKRLLQAWLLMAPLSYIAMETGWITREVGRQPWMVYGLMRTSESATALHSGTVGMSLAIFAVAYPVLFVLFLLFAWRLLKKGPDPDAALEAVAAGNLPKPPASGAEAA